MKALTNCVKHAKRVDTPMKPATPSFPTVNFAKQGDGRTSSEEFPAFSALHVVRDATVRKRAALLSRELQKIRLQNTIKETTKELGPAFTVAKVVR